MEEQVKFNFNITETDRHEAEVIFKENGITGLVSFINEKEDEWKKLSLNIGFIGNSGVGKSTLINVMQNRSGDDEGAAPVGNNQCTMEPTPYAHPNNRMLQLWDLPGVGTPEFSKDTYLEQIQFERFDFFLLVCANRFTENDLWLAEKIRLLNKRYFFVRTQMNVEVERDKRAHPKTHNKENVVNGIRENIEKNLKQEREKVCGPDDQMAPVFLIDSYQTNDYDFGVLIDRLIKDFPELKRSALVLSLTCFTEAMIKAKVDLLRTSIWRTAAATAAIAAIPLPAIYFFADKPLLKRKMVFIFESLGLDQKSLESLAVRFQVAQEPLTALIQSEISGLNEFLRGEITVQFLSSIGADCAVEKDRRSDLTHIIAAEVWRCVPVVGTLLSCAVFAPMSFLTTLDTLSKCLDKFELVSLKLLSVCIDASIKK